MAKGKYAGSDAWTTSAGTEELISAELEPNTNYLIAKEFDFFNKQDCVVNVNNTGDFLIPALVGFYDVDVDSFKVKTANVEYTYIIKY